MERGMIARGLIGGLLASLPVFAAVDAAAQTWVADGHTGCKVVDLYPDPSKSIAWSGNCRDGLADGPGTLTWSRRGQPEGTQTATFAAGKAQGPAEVIWANGRAFKGQVKDGMAWGQGTYTWADGRRYEGEWADDRRSGRGTLFFTNGDRFIGVFHRNKPVGAGEYVKTDGSRFTAVITADGKLLPGDPIAGAAPAAPAVTSAPPPPSSLPPARAEVAPPPAPTRVQPVAPDPATIATVRPAPLNAPPATGNPISLAPAAAVLSTGLKAR